MRKIASKRLYKYLEDTGALASGDESVIAEAKRRYRKEYKREWKRKQKDTPKREVRPIFTESQYQVLLLKARRNGHKNPTSYLKELALATLNGQTNVLPFKEKLTDILQNIALAGHSIHSIKSTAFVITTDQLIQVEAFIKEAEERLSEYLYLR